MQSLTLILKGKVVEVLASLNLSGYF